MKDLYRVTQNNTWDIIISSPYKRCSKFAEQLAKQKQCDLLLENQFQEMNFGDWTDIKTETLWQEYKQV